MNATALHMQNLWMSPAHDQWVWYFLSVKFAANAPVIVLGCSGIIGCILSFMHYAQSPVIGMQRSQTLREPQWDVSSPCCVHAHARLEHNGFSGCWGYKHGYLYRNSLLKEARFFAGLPRKHYKPVPLSLVPLFFVVSSRWTWFFPTGRASLELTEVSLNPGWAHPMGQWRRRGRTKMSGSFISWQMTSVCHPEKPPEEGWALCSKEQWQKVAAVRAAHSSGVCGTAWFHSAL